MAPLQAVLVSDLDGTIIDDRGSADSFVRAYGRFDTDVGLIYATGRSLRSALDSVSECGLPRPMAVIGSLGTEVGSGPGLENDQSWQASISDRWDREAVCDFVVQAGGEFAELALQSPLKVTCSFRIGEFAARVAILAQGLKQAGMSVRVVGSSGSVVDIVPEAAGKANGVRYVLSSLFPDNDIPVITAGNSGNDRDLFRSGWLGVVVANAHDDLLAAVAAPCFRASEKWGAGVVQGLEYWLKLLQQ